MKWVTHRGKNNRANILLRTDPSICIFRMHVLKIPVIHKNINIRVSLRILIVLERRQEPHQYHFVLIKN